jgi:hypothetical protein
LIKNATSTAANTLTVQIAADVKKELSEPYSLKGLSLKKPPAAP